jgi:hypothetical protein
MMLDEIDEARPMLEIKRGWINLLIHLGAVMTALAATLSFIRHAKPAERWRWGLILLLLAAAVALTVFYEYRFVAVMGLLTIIPLTALLQRGWLWIGAHWDGRAKVFAEIGLLLLVGPLPCVILPALQDGRSLNTGVLLFPVDTVTARTPCDTFKLEQVLKDPLTFGNRSRLILSSMGDGPELLFRTDHQVLSAPYHMDVSGNIDTTRFFSTPYASEAEAIARRRNVDLVVACRYVPEFYTRPLLDKDGKPGGDGLRDSVPHFIELLMTGHPPVWLKPVSVKDLNNYVIYEVLPPVTPPASAPKKSRRLR